MSVTINGSTGVSLVQDGVIVTADMASSVPLGAKNRIINGAMQIDQRNAGAAVTVTGRTYLIDRFASQNSTSTGTLTAQQSTLGNAKSLNLTATAAVTDLTGSLYVRGIQHILESQNIFDLNGKDVTLSFQVETNWSGNLSVAFLNSNSSRSYLTDVAVVSGINTATVTISFEAATVLVNSNAAGMEIHIGFNNEDTLRTATTGSWLAGVFVCSTSSTQWAKTTGNFINVTNVQLEEGSTATAFEHRSYGQELALCQRYYYQIGGNSFLNPSTSGYVIFASGIVYTTSACDISIPFKVTMRSTPTMTQNNAGLQQGGTLIAATSIGDAGSTQNVAFARVGIATASFTAGGGATYSANNSTTGYFAASSEL